MDRRVKNLLKDWKDYGQKAMESWKYYLILKCEYYPTPECYTFLESAKENLYKHHF
ncbi:MAG: hypothetical protein ACFFBT_02215 [Promethearchaeota archaeon]